jgi:putative acetyltransferase
MLLRPTIPSDVPAILSLIAGIFEEYDCKLNAETEDTHLLEPGPYFRASGGEFWVVEDEGSILATVAVSLHDDSSELKALYVHPTLRRHGWGRKLTELAIEHARAGGRTRMLLWSDTRFLAAHRLYQKMGFEKFGERDLNDSNNSREFGFEREI